MISQNTPFYGSVHISSPPKRQPKKKRRRKFELTICILICFTLLGFVYSLRFVQGGIPLPIQAYESNSPSYEIGETGMVKVPVVGIPTVPNPFYEQTSTSLLFPSLVRWLENSGAKVVPLILDSDLSNLKTMLPKLNGVVLQGGADSTFTEPYQSFHSHILEYAKQRHRDGDPFPVLGICLGMESILSYAGLELGSCNDNGFWRTLNVPQNSRMIPNTPFGNAFKEVVQEVHTSKFSHHLCAHVDDFESSVGHLFDITATTHDVDGTHFVAAFESKPGLPPTYGIQFHPEDVTYEMMEGNPPNVETILASTYMGNFFVQQMRTLDSKMTFNLLDKVGMHVYKEPYVFPLRNYYA